MILATDEAQPEAIAVIQSLNQMPERFPSSEIAAG
jgi:hypothetical protein